MTSTFAGWRSLLLSYSRLVGAEGFEPTLLRA
jgi:hypothetical protein